MKKSRFITVILLITAAIISSHCLPRAKYKSSNLLSEFDIPLRVPGWQGANAAGGLNLADLRYNFISEIFARIYTNNYGQGLLWLILDAGNFHNPKVCFGSSGFKITELPQPELKITNHVLQANAVYFEKGDEGYVIIYWICINKRLTDWTKQKFIQLWYSLFDKEKNGFMVRLDIPSGKHTTDAAIRLAQEFLSSIAPKIPPEQAEYIFGKSDTD